MSSGTLTDTFTPSHKTTKIYCNKENVGVKKKKKKKEEEKNETDRKTHTKSYFKKRE